MALTESHVLEPSELERIAELPLMTLVDPGTRELLVAGFERLEFAFGEVIVREGDPADGFYVIHEGTARALTTQRFGIEMSLGIVGPGDSFGEVAVLTGEPRSATVRAQGDVVALRLDQGVARAVLRTHPEVRAAFEAESRTRLLQDFLRLHSAFSMLERRELVPLMDELEEVTVKKGEIVIREGEAAGPMYLIKDGKLRARSGPPGNERDLRYLRTGAIFGELALVRQSKRTATIEAVTDSVLLALHQPAFQRLMDSHPAFRTRIEELVAIYDETRTPTIPLDFAAEILPADAAELAVIEDYQATVADEPIDPALGVDISAPDAHDQAQSGAATRRRRLGKRFPFQRQVDEMDCGVACLAMVCRFYGHRISTGFVRHSVGTGPDGTSLRGLQRGGEAAGLVVRTIKASQDQLGTLALPAIIHWEGNHWVVLVSVDGDSVLIADPARRLRRVKRSEVERRWSGFAALPSPTEALFHTPEQRSDPRWLIPFIKPYWPALVSVFVLTMIGTAIAFTMPILSQQIFDRVIPRRDHGLLDTLTGATLGLMLLSLMISLVQRRVMIRCTLAIDGAALDHLSGTMFDLPLGYFESRRYSDIAQRLAGVSQIRALLIQYMMGIITAILTIAYALIVMFAYSWEMSLAFLGTVPIYIGMVLLSRSRLRSTQEGLQEANVRYATRQLDAVQGIATVKTMGAEPLLRSRLAAEFRNNARATLDADLLSMRYTALSSSVSQVIGVAFLWLGTELVLSQNLSLGKLVAFNAIMGMAAGPIATLLGMWTSWGQASVLLNRLQDVFDTEPEMLDPSARVPVPTLAGAVSFRGVSFRYPAAPKTPVVEDFSLEVEPGMTVALVGRSGSGKSTLLKLIAGLLVPTRGAIYYDGVAIDELNVRQLRERLGVVLQAPYMFDDTIEANIAFGDPHPNLDAVRRAAEIADADGFIDRMPLGYKTKIGSTGIRLSGGQEQRVAIARAVYREPAVLLLDEATSALDTESERVVKQNLDRLLSGRTAFVVAHRLSTIRDADLIVVMERGRIAEQGTHEQLMALGGIYTHLSAQQFAP